MLNISMVRDDDDGQKVKKRRKNSHFSPYIIFHQLVHHDIDENQHDEDGGG